MLGQTVSLRVGLPPDPLAAHATLRHALAHVQAYLDEARLAAIPAPGPAR